MCHPVIGWHIYLEVFFLNIWKLLKNFLSLQPKNNSKMAYTKETMVIKNPSKKLLKAIEEMRKHKLAQLEKLRNMKPEDFSRRVILS